MIPILHVAVPSERERIEALLDALTLKPRDIVAGHSEAAGAVEKILNDVAQRGDAALVESARRFDDPAFTAEQIRVSADEMNSAAARVNGDVMAALRRSIAQVREYQTHIMPKAPATLRRPG